MKKQIILLFFLILALYLVSASFLNFHLIILFFIGIISSFIGTLAGGGGLITLPAMILTGIPIQTSIATNKFSSGIAAFLSVFYLIQQKHLSIKTIIQNLFSAFLGGVGGALITTHLSEKTMNMIAFILLFFALIVTLKNKGWNETGQGAHHESTKKIWTHFVIFSIAAYDGGFGPGSSTFSILYYMKKEQTYIKAVQLTRVLIFGSCAGAFIIFYQTGFIQWSYALAMAIGSIIGSQFGILVLPKVSLKMAKLLLITIMFFLITQMAYKIF
ncbi:sulfite exporter TauE/SafE family protein [Cytobacillus praedii]|uniref:sulfite exporter TauE/SafE family protein n=1 Tax=Cytobacillus praedii TaxID=1742358 RepID=UPI0009E7D6DC|nr:sulfite exporter TauE/SafE family protein [Cytobacillus praedii]